MTRALLALLAACGSEKPEPPPAKPEPAPVPVPAVTTALVGCTNALPAPLDPRVPIANPGASTGVATRSQASPRVVVDVTSVAGTLDAPTVRAILRRHTTKFQYCFEKQLLVQPDLAGGTIELGFAVQPTGYAASPRADGIDPEVARCATDAMKSVAFPAPIDQNQVQVTAQIRIIHTAGPARPRIDLRPLREWTPFAAETTAPDAVAAPLVAATAAVMKERLAAVEGCFDDARGAIRVVVGFDLWGRIKALRAGGLGVLEIERCVEQVLADFTVPAPSAPVEVACDFARGGAAPLRVAPDAGYLVVEVTPTHAIQRTIAREVRGRGARATSPLYARQPVLIVAEPDAPAAVLEYALSWVPAGPTLVAVKASGGAPVLVGAGTGPDRQLVTDKRVVELRTDNGRLRACVAGETLDATAPLLDPRAMDRVLAAAAAACQRAACEPTVIIGTSGEFVAKDLVATASAAGRAGFHQISVGGPACER